jgi:hypothetical protein
MDDDQRAANDLTYPRAGLDTVLRKPALVLSADVDLVSGRAIPL